MAGKEEQGRQWAGVLKSLLSAEHDLHESEIRSLEAACQRALTEEITKPATFARVLAAVYSDSRIEGSLKTKLGTINAFHEPLGDLIHAEGVEEGDADHSSSISYLNLGGAEPRVKQAVMATVLSSVHEGEVMEERYIDAATAERLAAVDTWQRCPYVHPLTCGKKSSHRILKARLREDTDQEVRPGTGPDTSDVILYCRDCGYEQELYPDLAEMVLRTHRGIEENGGHPMDDRLPQRWRTGDENG